jgi:hypothetical protein
MKTALFSMLMLLSTMALRAADRNTFDLTTLLGETYHGCRIIKVTPAALTVAYDNGVSKVSFELLGDSWRELYHYDPDKAREYAEREEAKRQQAEARLREIKYGIEQARNQQMNELIKAERDREALENKLVKEQSDADAKADPDAKAAPAAPPQPPVLAPFPGDPVIPQNPPISNIYTPGQATTGVDPGQTSPGVNTTGSSTGGYPFSYGTGYVYPPMVFPPRPPFRGPGMGRRGGPGSRYPGR